jgi:hypothetical protein
VFDTSRLVKQVGALEKDYRQRRATLVNEFTQLAHDEMKQAVRNAIVHTDLCMVVFNGLVGNIRLAGERLRVDYEDDVAQIKPIIDHARAHPDQLNEEQAQTLAGLAQTLEDKNELLMMRYNAVMSTMDKAVTSIAQVLGNEDLGIIRDGIVIFAGFLISLIPIIGQGVDAGLTIHELIDSLHKQKNLRKDAENFFDYYWGYAQLLEQWCIGVELAGGLLAGLARSSPANMALYDAAIQRVSDKRAALEAEPI